MNCQRCGFEQPEGPECVRCGVIFAKLRDAASPAAARSVWAPPAVTPPRPVPPPAPWPAPPLVPPAAGASAAAEEGGGHLFGDPLPGGGAAFGPAAAYAPPMSQSRLGQRLTAAANLTSGALLSETFSTYFANFAGFFIIGVVAHLPTLIQPGMRQASRGHLSPLLLVIPAMILLASGLSSAGVTFGVLQHLRGRPTSIGACLGQGFGAIVPVLLVILLQTVICAASLFACFIPFLFIWPMVALAVPAAVEERPGAVAALSRSAFLTAGYRGVVFMTFLILGVLLTLANVGLTAVLALLLHGSPATLKVAALLLQSVSGGIQATAAAVLYYRLRSVKEAIDVSQIASVFD
jgi:hypothetical protein